MKNASFVALAFVVTCGLSAPTLSQADNCNGRFTNIGIQAETIEVAKGHSVTYFAARGSASSENSIHNGVGECGGYALSTPDGKLRMVGVCARKNEDGDSWSDEWGLEPGAQRGWWKQSGGTGVFAGKTSAGWWQVVVDDGKATMGTWGGNCN